MARTFSRIHLLGLAAAIGCGGQLADEGDSAGDAISASGGAPEFGGAPAGGASSSGVPPSSSTGGADNVHGLGGAGGTGSTGGNSAEVPPLICSAASARFVTHIIEHQFGTGQNFNQVGGFPDALYGPPVAGDASSVVSLGNGGYVVVAFRDNGIVDGPGPDFTVFENPFDHFVELATVAVSNDLVEWHEFPCVAPQDADGYGSCAGVKPVKSNPTNGIDALDPAVSGGDSFDLAELGLSSARFVRITDRVDLDGPSGVFDLDAVGIVHPACGSDG